MTKGPRIYAFAGHLRVLYIFSWYVSLWYSPDRLRYFAMLFPDYKQFQALAEKASLVPVAKTVAADLRTPVSAFLNIAADEPRAFLLESVEGGEKVGRYTFLGVRPVHGVACAWNADNHRTRRQEAAG